MKLTEEVKLQQLASNAEAPELYLSPISTLHPPSLKNPIRVKLPDPPSHKDVKEILKRVRRQSGKPQVSQTAQYPVYPATGEWV
jgi:hypothetical protein